MNDINGYPLYGWSINRINFLKDSKVIIGKRENKVYKIKEIYKSVKVKYNKGRNFDTYA